MINNDNVKRILDVIDDSMTDRPLSQDEADVFSEALQWPSSSIMGKRLSQEERINYDSSGSL